MCIEYDKYVPSAYVTVYKVFEQIKNGDGNFVYRPPIYGSKGPYLVGHIYSADNPEFGFHGFFRERDAEFYKYLLQLDDCRSNDLVLRNRNLVVCRCTLYDNIKIGVQTVWASFPLNLTIPSTYVGDRMQIEQVYQVSASDIKEILNKAFQHLRKDWFLD